MLMDEREHYVQTGFVLRTLTIAVSKSMKKHQIKMIYCDLLTFSLMSSDRNQKLGGSRKARKGDKKTETLPCI